MKIFRISRLILTAALIGFIGCATHAADNGSNSAVSTNENEPKKLNLEDVTFRFDKNGNLVPVSAKGVRFRECEQKDGQTQCRIFKTPVKIDEIDTIQLTIIKHHNSPDCLYVSTSRGRGGLESGTVSEACLNK